MDSSFDLHLELESDDIPENLESTDREDGADENQVPLPLNCGLDCTDDGEPEILREEASFGNISPVFPSMRSKSGSFRLTPRFGEPKRLPLVTIESKDLQQHDLETPHHSINFDDGEVCPERPYKSRRSSILPGAEKSCRHLFIAGEENELENNLVISKGSNSNLSASEFCGGSEQDDVNASKRLCTDGRKSSQEKCIYSPRQDPSASDSVCSLTSCDASSCSSVSDIGSPNLSEIKMTKHTMESSPGDIADCYVEETVNDPPLNGYQNSELPKNVENYEFVGPKSPSVQSPRHFDGYTFSSSQGTTQSNWTVVSGVSPLPSSDPSHLRHHHIVFGQSYHHHQHHHHHRHHHRHHHHHGSGGRTRGNAQFGLQRSLSSSKIVITSTPNHWKPSKMMDVSSICAGNESDFLDNQISRFVLSSEVVQSSGDTSFVEQGNCSYQMDDQRENIQPAEGLLLSTNMKEQPDIVVSAGKGTASKSNNEVASELYTSCEFVPWIKDAGHTPFIRRLRKEEIKAINETPNNFSDEFFMEPPRFRRCSSVDETLSRVVDMKSPLSSSLGNQK